MIAYAAEATWGVPGPVFLIGYVVALVAVVGLAIAHRRLPIAGRLAGSPVALEPQEVAYLNGGEQLTVYAALAGLRAAGAIGLADKRLLQLTDRPAVVTPTEAAIYNVAGYSVSPSSLLDSNAVAGAVRQLRERLESAGLITNELQRRAIRRWALPCFALVLLGAIRIEAGSTSNHPTGYLMLATALALFAGLYLRTDPPATTTRAGRAAVARTRSQHRHLQRSSNPSYVTYGPAAAAMGVALFGTVALFDLDPAFAAQAEIHRTAAGDSNRSGSDNGSSCSSSDSGCGG
jgi:uncharacterized protein (TIGR04222 family)